MTWVNKNKNKVRDVKIFQQSLLAYFWCDGHFINISAYEIRSVRAEIQVFKRELYTHIYLG